MTLILTRADGEGIEIDGPAVIRVEHEETGDSTRIFIDAPRSTHVRRLEVGGKRDQHECGPLCPEHGDPRDTNITPKPRKRMIHG